MKKILDESSLYVITTEPDKDSTFEQMVENAIIGGADIVQYRDETSRSDAEKLEIIKSLKKVTKKYSIPFIVNNRVDLAVIARADGIHVGQDDIPVYEIKKNYKDFIVGVSTHSLEQARTAEKQGADYIGIGPVFETPAKPAYKAIGIQTVVEVFKNISIPAVCIGGINESNIDMLIEKKINRIAAVRAVCGAQNIKSSAKRFKDKLKKR
ncbi:thiamine phosphate synthase [bacterium]